MNPIIRAARAYYRVNVQAWQALAHSRINCLPVLTVLYLAVVFGLNFSGHTAAAWAATVVIGIPLLVTGWTT